ncbi:NAD(P)/FAD-dependent oxidoreductase [Streptomyces xiaopingdaonensis]|uniref:NAD(P)/FAD-dependent oxidoreductase n=1 Tax=Streptomyces xiaopingdaonensis TaxID=1565415 RepID=UPI000494D2BB|nr:FAD-dependent oxidoreductase [Streptomyces xiaopingdaonensis]
MRTVTVVGASLAGLHAARALRSQGFEGHLRIVGAEHHLPYDRPPLTKGYLTGAVTAEHLALTDAQDEAELQPEWLLGARATALDLGERSVVLADGRRLRSDGVVLATGAAAVPLRGTQFLGVHTLRTLEDAASLRAELREGQARVVVVGAGFIGAEVASSCASLGHRVTVVEAGAHPLASQLGEEIGALCAGLHADHGVTLVSGVGVAELHGKDGAGSSAGQRVSWVELTDGRQLPADIVVVGIGARPATAWLLDSGLPLSDGVVCDAGGVTEVPQVVAVGDVARSAGRREEHWTHAMAQPAVAVRNLLAGTTVAGYETPPYFWSDQYGARIQFAGRRHAGDTVRLVEGSPSDRSFAAVYEHEGVRTAAVAMNRPRPFAHLRRELGRPAGTVPA